MKRSLNLAAWRRMCVANQPCFGWKILAQKLFSMSKMKCCHNFQLQLVESTQLILILAKLVFIIYCRIVLSPHCVTLVQILLFFLTTVHKALFYFPTSHSSCTLVVWISCLIFPAYHNAHTSFLYSFSFDTSAVTGEHLPAFNLCDPASSWLLFLFCFCFGCA